MRNIHCIAALQGIRGLAMEIIFREPMQCFNVKKKNHGCNMEKNEASLIKVSKGCGLLGTPSRSVNLSRPHNGSPERGEMKAFPIP